jgi:hypothetical protein
MKKLLLTLLFSGLCSLGILAQTSLGVNYQAVIRNSAGEIVADQQIGLQLSILQGSATGAAVYSETFTPTTNEFGLINVIIGHGSPKSGKYTSIDWSSANYYLKVDLDIDGSTNYTEMGTTQLLSVPYANYAFSGNDGKSAYQIWLELGNTGTEQDFFNSLTGPKGDKGENGAQGPVGPVGPAGSDGTDGKSMLNGTSDPLSTDGKTGDFFLNTTSNNLFGPKTESGWGAGISMVGPQGTAGIDGKTILSGTTIPLIKGGNIGDYYLNTSTYDLYGPKTENGWGSPVSLIGADGTDGNTMLNGTSDPLTTDGKTGDFFLNTTSNNLFGPKTENGWGTGISMVGPQGEQGPAGTSSWTDQETIVSTDKKVGVGTTAPNALLEVQATGNEVEGQPLFEVKNSKGETIFAVYENGVEIFIDEESETKTKGAFAISGRTTTKATEQILTVTPTETTVYVEEPTAKTKGGFAISGRTTTKEGEADLLRITPSLTQFYVDETVAKTKGAFAISGRTTTKTTLDILNITPGLTQIYVDEPVAKTKGGFAISGRTTTKVTQDVLNITPSLTQFYVDEPIAKTKGGFAISGRTTTKEGEADILTVIPGLTQVFVDETTSKTKGGFAISGRTTTKETGVYDVFTVVPERTDVYVKPSASKNSLPIGFSVKGLSDMFEPTELFSISEQGTYVATALAVKPKVTTGLVVNLEQTSASSGGTVVDDGGSEIVTKGLLYYLASMQQPTLENATTLNPSVGGVVSIGGDKPFENLFINDLTPNTLYKVRAFATNLDGLTGFGDAREFKTLKATTLTINVTDGALPIENAMVTLWLEMSPEPITSGPSSTHTFTISDGYHSFLVEAEGYLDSLVEGYNLIGDQIENIILEPTSLPKVIFTIKNQYGDPIEGVGVNVSGASLEYTNNQGIATFFIAAGTYPYTVEVPQVGYETHTGGSVVVNATPATQYVNETVTEQPKITFLILDPNGNPYPGWVGIDLFEPEGISFYEDAYDGKAVFYNVGFGTWTYRTQTEGLFPEQTGTVEVVSEESQTVTITLENYPSEYTVTIKVIDLESTPIDDAKVTLFATSLYSSVRYTGDADYNEETGKATFLNVPALEIGSYTLYIEKNGYNPIETTIDINRYGNIVEPGHILNEIIIEPLALP